MRAVSVLFVATIALSAGIPHSTFRYELFKSFRRDGDICRICYGDECTNMEEYRCQYYVEVDDIIEKPSGEGQVTEVDAMMYDLTEQADRSWTVQKCIPLISQYTDCTKDNICVGCKSCSCSEAGKWSCSDVQRCRAEAQTEVDHKMLVMVIEKLNELKNEEKLRRRKRTVVSSYNQPEVKRMSLSDIAEWMYGVKPNISQDWVSLSDGLYINTTTAVPKYTDSFSTQSSPKLPKATDTEYLDFAEVLKSVAIEDQSYKRRKSQLKMDNDTAIDINCYKINNGSDGDRFIQVLSAIEEDVADVTESKIDDATFLVDLIPKVFKNNNFDNKVTKDDFEISNIINKEDDNNNTFDFGISNEKIELNAIYVMKRDISSVTDRINITLAAHTTSSTSEASTNTEGFILENVLTPLTNIIDDKIHEVKELTQIRERLVHFINNHDKTKLNITNDSDIINSSNTHVAVYKLDLFPKIQQNLRRTNPNVLEKLLYKLKRDIYEVLKDITRIQTLSKTYGLPDDLKVLIRSMQRYIHTQVELKNIENKNHINENPKKTRRLMPEKPDDGYTDNHHSINNQLLDILEGIDKNKPKSNALMLLSKSTKKIMKRVINQNYVDEFYHAGLRVYDDQYNLTNDLKTIGKSWPYLTANIAKSSPHEKLYAMKLLHFALVEDINKIKDAISLVDFSHSRRMMSIGVRTAEIVMDRITEGLTSLKNKILLLIKYHNVTKQSPLRENISAKSRKKESFFNKIRNLLRHSKLDVFNMVKKKTTNTGLVNKFAERQLNELKEPDYENTMLKWQKYLSMARRKKRELKSHLRGMKNMIKSIIPKYLQGKINPALFKNHKREKPRSIQR